MTSATVTIILPIFSLIGLGYLAAVSRYLDQSVGDALGKFVTYVAIPLLLFRSLAQAELPDDPPFGLWFGYFSGIAVAWSLSTMVFAAFGGKGAIKVIAGVCGGYSNLVLIGIPLVTLAFGDEGLLIMLMIISIHLPAMVMISTFLFEISNLSNESRKTQRNFGHIAKKLALATIQNPIIVGILVGLIWHFTGLPLEPTLEQVITSLGKVAAPTALFLIGMVLHKYGLSGNLTPAIFISSIKLIIMPAVVWIMCQFILQLPSMWTLVAVLGAGLPTGINGYLFAHHFNSGHGLASNTITISTVISIFTLTLWLWILR